MRFPHLVTSASGPARILWGGVTAGSCLHGSSNVTPLSTGQCVSSIPDDRASIANPQVRKVASNLIAGEEGGSVE